MRLNRLHPASRHCLQLPMSSAIEEKTATCTARRAALNGLRPGSKEAEVVSGRDRARTMCVRYWPLATVVPGAAVRTPTPLPAMLQSAAAQPQRDMGSRRAPNILAAKIQLRSFAVPKRQKRTAKLQTPSSSLFHSSRRTTACRLNSLVTNDSILCNALHRDAAAASTTKPIFPTDPPRGISSHLCWFWF